MCYFIGVEDLAANALIELLESGSGRREVSFRELEACGAAVVKELRESQGQDCFLLLSQFRMRDAVRECSDILEIKGYGTLKARVALLDGCSRDECVRELSERFCSSICIPVLQAMSARRPLEQLQKVA